METTKSPAPFVPVIFQFKSHEVRTVMYGSEPWFVAKDVADILGYSRPENAISAHCKAAKTSPLESGGQVRHMTIIPERDVYRLIMRSKLPSAEKFEEWVVGEVLPAIRETGKYDVAPQFQIPQTLPEALRLAANLAEKNEALEALNSQLAPKAEIAERITAADGYMTLTDTAKILQVRPREFSRWLQAHRWIYKRPGSRSLIPYQEKIQAGYLELKCVLIPSAEDQERTFSQTIFLPKGITKLAEIFGQGKAVAA